MLNGSGCWLFLLPLSSQQFTCLTAFHANCLCDMSLDMVVQAWPLHSLLLRKALSPSISKGYCDDCDCYMDASLCIVGAGPRRNPRRQAAPELFTPDWTQQTRKPSVRVQKEPSKKGQEKKRAGTGQEIEAFLPVQQREIPAIMPAEESSFMSAVIVTGTPQAPCPAPILPNRFTRCSVGSVPWPQCMQHPTVH